MSNISLGEKIEKLRKKKNLTQEDLALLLDISDKSISKWENDISKPTINNLEKLSSIFDISIDELLKNNKKDKKKVIHKIVLTGGPCAGKTTAKSWIQNYFEKQDYKVLFIEELATELINSGVKPWEFKNYIDFQNMLFNLQKNKEDEYLKAAKKLPYNKILIVCDRGLLDIKAYLSKKDYNYLLDKNKLTEAKIYDRYDAVFHLVTAAKGAKKYYNLDNNARSETIEEAERIDNITLSSWTGHPHLRIIDNKYDFETKMRRLIKEISLILNEKEPLEIERKYLIEKPDISYLKKLDNCQKIQIVQTYLKSGNNEEIRVRQRGINDSYTYTKTKKISINSLKRIEIEKRITEEEYIKELYNIDPSKGQIVKERYCLSYNNKYYEIDIFPFWDDKAILEVELYNEDEKVQLPSFINVIEEVTDKEEYKNRELAKMIKKCL